MRRLLALVLTACTPAASPEPAALSEARTLVALSGPVLASARPACAALPPDRGEACTAALDALASVVATATPLLTPCPGEVDDPDRQACEVDRLDKVRATLPELRRRVTEAAAVVR